MSNGILTQLATIEDRHWWFRYRRILVCDYLDKCTFSNASRALDLGCGTGYNMKLLNRYCPEVYGIELSKEALKIGSKKYNQYQFINGDINHVQNLFPGGYFELITLFNVLYHKGIISEKEILRQIHHILKPGGTILFTEPAFKILMRGHDIADMGKTRYRLRHFASMLAEIGFEDIRGTYFNSVSFFPAFLLALVERSRPSKNWHDNAAIDELRLEGPILNRLMLRFLDLERLLIKLFKRMPLGVTLLCAARKSSCS